MRKWRRVPSWIFSRRGFIGRERRIEIGDLRLAFQEDFVEVEDHVADEGEGREFGCVDSFGERPNRIGGKGFGGFGLV